ncbi:MAG: hypothetical protein HY537_11585 [Deltaproteobacteria bacterium]|nr:hypothetical protein [Deltaproteobacteria bacterium]
MPLKKVPSSSTPPSTTQEAFQNSEEPLPQAFVAGIESYGSSRVTEAAIRKVLGADFDTWIKKGLAGDAGAEALETQLSAKIKKAFDLALAEWSVMHYFEEQGLAIYITLDVVEKADTARRMPFLPAPKGKFPDPDSLISQWMQYETTALQLAQAGELGEQGPVACPAFHCPFGHKHPKLKPFEKAFVDGAKKNEKALVEIQAKDERAEYRGAATFLLPYLKDGKKVLSLMLGRVRDSDALVRNNTLRVLGDIAEFHKELMVPLKPILEALQFPRVSDRAKAVYVVHALANQTKEMSDALIKDGLPQLLTILASTQPNHREVASAVLRRLSGKTFKANDLAAWKAWADSISTSRAITKSK